MSKLILILLLACLTPSSFAFGRANPPNSIEGYKVEYYDYENENKFKFNKLSDAAFEEINGYILTEIDEITAALNDPNSHLRESMASQKVNTFLIPILVEDESEYIAGPCTPYMDDGFSNVCSVTTVLHVYGNRVCISKKDEYLAMALKELASPTCPLDSDGKPEKEHKSLLSIPLHLHFK